MVRMTNLRRTQTDFEERVLEIKRVAKVVQGGRRFSFRAAVVLGDKKGRVGLGVGKAKVVTSAVAKAVIDAKRNMFSFPLDGTTIPHETFVKYKGVRILLKPARKGTGVIAGGPIRAFAECGGIHDLLSKSLGSSTTLNVARAMVKGLAGLKPRPGMKPAAAEDGAGEGETAQAAS